MAVNLAWLKYLILVSLKNTETVIYWISKRYTNPTYSRFSWAFFVTVLC